MKTTARVAAVVAAIVFVANSAMADPVNVAAGKTVTLNGSFSGAPASTLVDGNFLPRSTWWQGGTVWWTEPSNSRINTITIDLGGTFAISSLVIQADDNDGYLLQYHNPINNSWNTAWDVPNYDAYGWGMQTRPNPDNDAIQFVLGSPIVADQLKFMGTISDDSLSVSEIQAYGQAVPEPATMSLLLCGLAGLLGGAVRNRRK